MTGYMRLLFLDTPISKALISPKDQINWFLQESAKIQPIERPFTPDTAKDFGSIWTRQADQITPTTRKLAKPNAMMFFHIPLWVHTTPHSF
jgi:hypothetical protein